jgi:hypothetical protein
MVELVLAGVIVAAVGAAALMTGVADARRRRAERLAAEADRERRGEPIPGGWPGSGGAGAPPVAPRR